MERIDFRGAETVLREAMAGLEGLSEEQAGQWLRVAWYLVLLVFHRREEKELMNLIQEQTKQSKFHERAHCVNIDETLSFPTMTVAGGKET